MRALISISEFGEIFGVSRSTVYRLKERGEITFVHVGRAVRIRRDVAENWFASLTEVASNDA